PILDDFERLAASVTYHRPKVHLISSVTGREANAKTVNTASYWRQQVREAVRFSDSIKSLHEQGYQAILEIGPEAVLTEMAQTCVSKNGELWLGSLQRGKSEWEQMLSSLSTLYIKGVSIDWEGFDRSYTRKRVVLPTYPFERKRHWLGGSHTDAIKQRGEATEQVNDQPERE